MPQDQSPQSTPYEYKIGFGAWINDLRNTPLPVQNWPAPQYDEDTGEGAIRALDVMGEAGYDMLDAFGLWATGDYPLDIVSAFEDADRHRQLDKVFTAAAERGIGMVMPMGLMTWGYDRIIREDPEVRGKTEEGEPHPHAMCGAKEKSWEYVRKILDAAFDRFDFAGVHLESADLGWCGCDECARKYGVVGYNCRLNKRAADYIKTKWPNTTVYTIPINWIPATLTEDGERNTFSRAQFEDIIDLSKHIDIFMDQGHRGRFVSDDWVPQLKCAYGTSGGLWVYHCVRMDRLSYVIPYPKRACEYIREHYDLGARACLYYLGPMTNPGVELNTAVAGRALNDPTRSPDDLLQDVIEEYYGPQSTSAGEKLAAIYMRIEDGYFGRWDADQIRQAHKAPPPGELHLAGLFGDEPEYPGHLAPPYLDKPGRAAYRDELLTCLADLEGIKRDFRATDRIIRLIRALTLTVQFLKMYIAFYD